VAPTVLPAKLMSLPVTGSLKVTALVFVGSA
jgi:hypothetical protein